MRDSPRGTTAVRGASPQHRVFSPSSPNHRPLPGVGGAMREDSHRRPTSETTNTTTTDPWKVASSSPVWDGGSDSIDPFFQSTTTNKNTSTTNNNTNTNTNTNTNSLTRQSPRRHPRSSAGRIPPSPDNRISSAREPSSDPKTTTAFRGRLMEGPTKINTNNPVVVVEDVTGWVTTEPTIRNSSGGSPWASAGANNNNNDWFVTNAVSSLSVQTATTTATTAIGGTPQGHSRQTPSRWNPSSSPHHRRAVATAATGRDWPPQQDQPNTNNSNCAMASLYSPSTLFDDEGDVVDRAAATEPTTSTAAAVVAPLGSSRRPILAVAASTTATATAHTPDATTNNNTNRILVEEDGTAKRPISIHDADLLDQREKDVLNQASRKQQHQQPVILGNNNNTPLESQNSNSNSNCSNNNSMRQSRSVPLAAPQATTTMNTAREHDILQQAAAKRQQERTEATVLLNSYSASTNSETALVMNSKVKKATGGNYRNNKNAHTHQGKGIMGFFRGGMLGGKRNETKTKGKVFGGSKESSVESSTAKEFNKTTEAAAIVGSKRPTVLVNAWGSVTEKPKLTTPRFSIKSPTAAAASAPWAQLSSDDENSPRRPTMDDKSMAAKSNHFNFNEVPAFERSDQSLNEHAPRTDTFSTQNRIALAVLPSSGSNDDTTTVSGVTNPSAFYDERITPTAKASLGKNPLTLVSKVEEDPFDRNSPLFSIGDPYRKIRYSPKNQFPDEPVLSDDFSDPFFPSGTDDVTKEESGISEAPDPDLDHVNMTDGESSNGDDDTPPVLHVVHQKKWVRRKLSTNGAEKLAIQSVANIQDVPNSKTQVALSIAPPNDGVSIVKSKASPTRRSVTQKAKKSYRAKNTWSELNQCPSDPAESTAMLPKKSVISSSIGASILSKRIEPIQSTVKSQIQPIAPHKSNDVTNVAVVTKQNYPMNLGRARGTKRAVGSEEAFIDTQKASIAVPSVAVRTPKKGLALSGASKTKPTPTGASTPLLPPAIVRISTLPPNDHIKKKGPFIVGRQDENIVSTGESSRPRKRGVSGDLSISSVGSDIQRLRSILRRSRLNDSSENVRYIEPLESAFFSYDEKMIKDPMQRAGLRLLSTAVIPIQSAIRRYLAFRAALLRMCAIVVIQATIRSWIERVQYNRQMVSAISIQSFFRGVCVRDQLLLEHCCAIEIQRHVRGFNASLKVFEELYKITMVQACIRRKLAINRSMDRMTAIVIVQSRLRGLLIRMHRVKLNEAVIRVQTVWRAFSGRFNFQLDLLDVLIVQSIFRRRSAIIVYKILLHERRVESAIAIQSQWRSYDCTMIYLHYLADVLIAQSTVRRWIAYKRCKSIRNDNALVIQTAVRGFLARNEVARIRSAILIQSTWRGFVCYADYMFTISDIVMVQSVARCWLKRKDFPTKLFEHKSQAAITIQKVWRGFSQATDFFVILYERKAAISIQTYWRRFVHYSNFAFVVECTILLQSVIRGHLSRSNLGGNIHSAMTIQCAYRALLARKKSTLFSVARSIFVESGLISAHQNDSSIIIQSRVRGVQIREAVMLYKSTRTVQSAWRRYQARAEFSRLLMALRIQTTWRRYVALVEYDIYRTARRVQTLFRAYMARSKFRIYRATRQIQTAWRRYSAISGYVAYIKARHIQTEWRRHLAQSEYRSYTKARCIQTVWRRYSAFSTLKTYYAARSIQAVRRGQVARSHASRICNARKIQSSWRGFTVRWPYKEYIAARRIQSSWRRMTARKSFNIYVRARTIQAWYRYVWQRSKYQNQKMFVSARCIQTNWRGRRLYSAYQKYVSARRVQSMFRSKRLSSAYKQYVTARRIQTIFRCKRLSSAYKQYVAARRIQTIFRCKSLACAYKKHISACRVQAFYRCKSVALAYRHYIAARRIQSVMRGTYIQQCYRKYVSARRLQAFARGRFVYQAYTQYVSARRIQSVVRCRSLCKRFQQFKRDRIVRYSKISAVCRIQSHWRKVALHSAYKRFIASRRIQTFYRCNTIRRSYGHYTSSRTMRHQKYVAACRIQAYIRCKRHCRAYKLYKGVRSLRVEQYKAARRIQTYWRCATLQKQYNRYQWTKQRRYEEFLSACRIQTGWRCYSQNTAFNQYSAARRIQACVRGKSLRQAYIQFVAARRIQSLARGKALRQAYTQFVAARHIQALARGKALRQAYTQFVAARRIQSMARGKLLRSAYIQYVAARSIQTQIRGTLLRTAYTQYIAARRIQSICRVYPLQKAYREYLAARCIQSFWRTTSLQTAYSQYRAARRIQTFVRCISINTRITKKLDVYPTNICKHLLVTAALQEATKAEFSRRTYKRRILRILEKDTMSCASTDIAKTWRGFEARQSYWHVLGSVIEIQSIVRGWIAQQRLWALRHRAVVQIESAMTIKRFVDGCVTKRRAKVARKEQSQKMDKAARNIQGFFLMVKAEVDRAIVRAEKKRRKAKKKMKAPPKDLDELVLETVWRQMLEEKDPALAECLVFPMRKDSRSSVAYVSNSSSSNVQCNTEFSKMKPRVLLQQAPRVHWSEQNMADDLDLEEAWMDVKILQGKEHLRHRTENRSSSRSGRSSSRRRSVVPVPKKGPQQKHPPPPSSSNDRRPPRRSQEV